MTAPQVSYSLLCFCVAQDHRMGLKGVPIVKKHHNFNHMSTVIIQNHNLAWVDELKNLFHKFFLLGGGAFQEGGPTFSVSIACGGSAFFDFGE